MERRKRYFGSSLVDFLFGQRVEGSGFLSAILFLAFWTGMPSMVEGQQIFPGAEGFGTTSRSAYGGKILPRIVFVNNLNPEGPGSFKHAVGLPFPRLVVFNVSGVIQTTDALVVKQPYLFIAGQTATEGGVTFAGAPFIVETHDVLVQSMRFRLGAKYGRQADCVSITGTNRPVYNVVFDHCSFAFGLDENVGILNAGPGITISNCIIGYGLNLFGHSCGLLALNVKDLSLIRNVFAHNRDRNPNIRGGSNRVEIVNNLIYNSGAHASYVGSRAVLNGAVQILMDGNLYVTGVDNKNEFLLSIHREAPDTTQIFWGNNETINGDKHYRTVEDQVFDQSGRFSPLRKHPFLPRYSMVWPVDSLQRVLLPKVGPQPGRRDALDSLILRGVKYRSGKIIQKEDELVLPSQIATVRSPLLLPCHPHEYPAGSSFTNMEIFLNDLIK